MLPVNTKEKSEMTLEEFMNFTPKQMLATQAADTHKYTLFGGSRGPGKSYWLRRYSFLFHLRCSMLGFKNVVTGIFSEDYPTLRDRVIANLITEIPPQFGKVKEKTSSHGLAFYFTPQYGSGVIELRNLAEGNLDKYRSSQFAMVAIEELTNNPSDIFDVLRATLRWPGIDETRFIAVTNPNGPHAGWVKNFWIDKIYPPEMQTLSHQFAFVKALPTDNPHLSKSYFEDELGHLSPELQKAWLYGSWDVAIGQAFKEFYPHVHVLKSKGFDLRGMDLYCSVDWGYQAPFAIHWHAVDYDGTIFTYREYYGSEVGRPDKGVCLPARTVAQNMRMFEGGEDIIFRVADTQMWQQHGVSGSGGTARTIADDFLDEGVDIIPCVKDRIQMKQQVHNRLIGYEGLDESGIPIAPAWYILDCCPNLIRTLPTMQIDKTNIEKVSEKGEDHCYTGCGYFLMKRFFEPDAPMAEPPSSDRYQGRSSRGRNKKSWKTA